MAPTARAAAGAAAAANKSPLPTARPNSSRLAGWDGTPAAAAVPAGLADRPPFTVGGPLTGGAAAGGVGAGVGGVGGAAAAAAAAGTAKADRGGLQKLQAALDAKCEELMGVRDQLKESQVRVGGAAGWIGVVGTLSLAFCMPWWLACSAGKTVPS
jgi:hypothetical protein